MQNRTYSLYRHENYAVREAYSILAGNIYVDSEKKKVKSLVITSTEPMVGKTSVATSLAITLATWGKRVVLINADMRTINYKEKFDISRVNGTYEYLQGVARFEDVLHLTNVENLMYIPSGRVINNPMGLLCSIGLIELIDKANKCFDYIIFDTPPLSSVSDATIIASKADATLLVTRMNKTKLEAVSQARELLEKCNSNLLGVVINQVGKKDYKRSFGAYNYFNKANKQAIPTKMTNEGSRETQLIT